MTSGRELPWLQEEEADQVWGNWEQEYRDVVIVDHENMRVTAFNLTTNNLGQHDEAGNFVRQDELKALLYDAAGIETE